jgi:hypothetical protein
VGIGLLSFVVAGGLKAHAGDGGPEILRVKGLYLGMSMDEAANILKGFITPEISKKLGEGEPLEITQIPPFEKCTFAFGYFRYGPPIIFLQSDCSKSKKVYSISIHGDIADKMFGTERLNQEKFVQAFEDTHNITMQLKERAKSSDRFRSGKSWEFESPHGYKVTVRQGHTIIIEKAAGKSE